MSRPGSAASRKRWPTRWSIWTELVVKPVGESGGYGITIGPRATKGEIALARERLLADPANYISQPVIDLSVSPTLIDGRGRAAPRRSAAVRGHRQDDLGAAGRPFARGAQAGLPGGQLAPRAADPRTPGSWQERAA